MINFVSVCTDLYPIEYAVKLHRRFNNLTNLKASHWCITDRPFALPSYITPIEPFTKAKGWWNKINLFSNQMPAGTILYMDLDIVLVQNFDEEINSMLASDCEISCVSDAINWMGQPFSSSMMLFQSGTINRIYEKFKSNEKELQDAPGGDQVWVGPQLKKINFIDKKFPKLKQNLKFHLAKRTSENKLHLPFEIDSEIKLIDCGGHPKPHELSNIPYIHDNWHTV